jgi:hypothetical protein
MTPFEAQTDCPTLAELAAFAAGDNEPLAAHVQQCRRCKALANGLPPLEPGQPAAGVPRPEFTHPTVSRDGSPPTGRGEIVIASSPDAPETLLVCVVLDPNLSTEPVTLEVAPLSTETTMASDFDVVLPQGDPLGYAALASRSSQTKTPGPSSSWPRLIGLASSGSPPPGCSASAPSPAQPRGQ